MRQSAADERQATLFMDGLMSPAIRAKWTLS